MNIKLQKELPLKLIATIILLIGIVVFIIINTNNNMSLAREVRGWKIIISTFAIALPFLFMQINKVQETLTQISILPDTIKLIFKKNGQITKTIDVLKKDIKSFNMEIFAEQKQALNQAFQIKTSYELNISRFNNSNIQIKEKVEDPLAKSEYNGYLGFIYNILKYSEHIPNFEFNLTTNSNVIKEEVDYYKKHKKIMHLTKRIQLENQQFSAYLKFIFVLFILLTIIGPVLIIFFPLIIFLLH